MHPTVSYELAKAGVTDLRHQTQRDASACTGRRARRTPARPNVDDARRCSPPACSDRMRRAPALWRRRSGRPYRRSVPVAALAV